MTALEWAAMDHGVQPPDEWYCRTESDWQGRFEKFVPYVRAAGVNDPNLPLVANVLGEVGDNCFAHNLASWPDIPGCWFSWDMDRTAREVRFSIADRGRGIFASLSAVRPHLISHSDALRVALSEQISGREPEDRGRGLKVALLALTRLASGLFVIQSGDAEFFCPLPYDGADVAGRMRTVSPAIQGTYCAMTYRYES